MGTRPRSARPSGGGPCTRAARPRVSRSWAPSAWRQSGSPLRAGRAVSATSPNWRPSAPSRVSREVSYLYDYARHTTERQPRETTCEPQPVPVRRARRRHEAHTFSVCVFCRLGFWILQRSSPKAKSTLQRHVSSPDVSLARAYGAQARMKIAKESAHGLLSLVVLCDCQRSSSPCSFTSRCRRCRPREPAAPAAFAGSQPQAQPPVLQAPPLFCVRCRRTRSPAAARGHAPAFPRPAARGRGDRRRRPGRA